MDGNAKDSHLTPKLLLALSRCKGACSRCNALENKDGPLLPVRDIVRLSRDRELAEYDDECIQNNPIVIVAVDKLSQLIVRPGGSSKADFVNGETWW